MKRIIIIGGMGPQASLDLHKRIIAGAAKRGAQDNNEYPTILHISIPVDDFITEQETQDALALLKYNLEKIELNAEDKIVLACNTAHILQAELEEIIGCKLVSLIDATLDSLSHHDKKIAVVASPVTIRAGLYAKQINTIERELLLPDNNESLKLEKIIRAIIANRNPTSFISQTTDIVDSLKDRGATKVILGCTELSLILRESLRDDIVDPLAVITDNILQAD